MRRALFLIHLYLGLSLGLLASIVGLTGSLLVFRHELESLTTPALKGVRESAGSDMGAFSPERIVRNVAERYPDKRIQTINLPPLAGAPIEVWLDKDPLRIYADPYSGALVGFRDEDASFFGRLFKLHTEYLSGEKGHTLAGIVGLGLIVLCLTGLVVWWPRKNQQLLDHVRIRCRAGFKRANYDFHRAAGFFACLFLLLIATTGVALVFPDPAKALAFRFAGQKEVLGKPRATSQGPLRPLDELVDVARKALPGGTVRRIVLPSKPGDPLLVRLRKEGELHPNGMNYVYLDPRTGAVLRIDRDSGGHAGQRAMNLRYPLHIGLWAGTASRLLQALLGLMPSLLFLSGCAMWWSRRKRQFARTSTRLSA